LINFKREKEEKENIRITNSLEFNPFTKTIYFNKPVLSPEDELALKFSSVLEKLGIRYVIVAGYIAVLFGRNRRTDDVDFIVEELSEEKFIELCRELGDMEFELMQGNIRDSKSLRYIYYNYLREGYRVRLMWKNIPIPNIELKMKNKIIEEYVLRNAIRVQLLGLGILRISPLEIQIAYKLRLGSIKDIEDARFLYNLFINILDKSLLNEWCRKLGVNTKWLK